jgi:excisionase family DNA binding protein
MDDNESGVPVAKDQLHDLDAIARRLNVSTKMVRRLIARGELGYHQVGRLKRVSDDQYLEYLGRAMRCQVNRASILERTVH